MDVAVVNYRSPEAASNFARSLHETGFAVLVNHPIPTSMLSSIYQEWSDFFDSPAKLRYLFSRDRQDGYFPRPTNQTPRGDQPGRDDKEFFHVFPWGRYPDDVSDAATRYRLLAMQVATKLLGWVEQFAPAEVVARIGEPLSSTLAGGEKNTLLRILRYPGAAATDMPGNQNPRAGAHKDTNLITLLASATHPGLQVRTRGGWQDVPWDFGSIAINAGEMLDLMTGGYFPAVSHRVVTPPGTSAREPRLSMPLFLHPADDVLIDGKTSAAVFLRERLASSYTVD